MASQDCLLNCLHEVRLDRFHRNFVERGLLNCEQLSSLTHEDYARFGVVSTDDRHRLSQLIHIIKSVQADGMFCQHGGILPPAHTKSVPKPNIPVNVDQIKNGQTTQSFVGRNSRVPVSHPQSGEQLVRERCPPAPSKSFIKPFNGDLNYRVQYERPCKQHSIEEAKVLAEKSDDSPMFECRKTLKFSDSDLFSDDESESTVSSMITNGKPNSYQNMNSNDTALSVAHVSNSGSSVYMNIQSSQRQIIKEPSFGKGIESKLTNAPSLSNGALAEPKLSRKSDRRISQVQSDIDSSVGSSRTVLNGTTKAAHHPVKRLSTGGLEELKHAYFPTPSIQTMQDDLPIQVGKVYGTTGYNYGVPNAGMLHAAQQRTSDLQIDGEMRGYIEKIRVCVRKRPRTVREAKRNEVDVVKVRGRQTVIVEELKVAVDLTKYMQQHLMTFDVAFDEQCRNKDVYERAVKPLVSAVFERCSAVCFAFGQTGAGKTYTLLGNKSEPGLYQLAGEDLFILSRSAANHQGSLHIWVSYYEIYCGHLFDLLNKRKRLHVRENGRHKVCITGLMENEVCDLKSLIRVVSYGNTFRSHGSTGVNPHSSRSHALLQLEVRDNRDAKIGRMTFIDLAGSERAADAINSDRQTRMEGAEINQSLLALKECIRSIDQEACHTPYRQSKLTHILRESFLGQSLTVMIANVAPTQAACEDTLNTLRYADRVKELTKEAAKKANRSGNGGNATSVGNVTQTILQAPISSLDDEVHSSSSARNPIKPHTIPSVFHPSNIQFTSTPLKTGSISKPHAPRDSPRSIFDGAGELPISGHKIFRGSVEELQLDRISPISDLSKHTVELDLRRNCSSPDIVGNCKANLPHIASSSHGVADYCSPCSCRSAEDLSAPVRVSMLTSDMPVWSVHRNAVSEKNEPRVLFSEVKASMENARANIRNFLQGEKDLASHPVVLANIEYSDPPPTLLEYRPSCLVDEFLLEGSNKNGSKDSVQKTDSETRLKTRLSAASDNTVDELVNKTAGVSVDTKNSRPPSNTVAENASSMTFIEGLETNSAQNKDAGVKSWAEIFEKSADSFHNDNGVSVKLAMPGDSKPVDDIDLVTPEMLETLKVKIADLKLRQDRLERGQLFARGPQSTLITSHQVSNSTTSQNLKSEEKLVDVDGDGHRTIGCSSNILPQQSIVVTGLPMISSEIQSNKQHNDNILFYHGNGLPISTSSNNFSCKDDAPNVVHCNAGLPNVSSYTGGVFSNSKSTISAPATVCSEHNAAVVVAESECEGNSGAISSISCNAAVPSIVVSSHVHSAFRIVDRKKEPGIIVNSNSSKETAAVTNSSHQLAVKMLNSDDTASAQPVVRQLASFMPIEPQPVTIPVNTPPADVDRRQFGDKEIELSGSSTDSLHNDALMPEPSAGQNVQSEEYERKRSENLLVMSHEDQLTAIIHLCKQEMSLLIDVRSGSMNFDVYLQNVQNILSTKQKIISALNLHISEFRY